MDVVTTFSETFRSIILFLSSCSSYYFYYNVLLSYSALFPYELAPIFAFLVSVYIKHLPNSNAETHFPILDFGHLSLSNPCQVPL